MISRAANPCKLLIIEKYRGNLLMLLFIKKIRKWMRFFQSRNFTRNVCEYVRLACTPRRADGHHAKSAKWKVVFNSSCCGVAVDWIALSHIISTAWAAAESVYLHNVCGSPFDLSFDVAILYVHTFLCAITVCEPLCLGFYRFNDVWCEMECFALFQSFF